MRLSRKQQGRKPPEVRILPTPRTPHGNRSHEGARLGRCALHYNTGMDGGPCGKGAVLLRLLGRKPPASSTLAPSASRSAVIGHGIGPGIQSAKTGWIGMAERSRAYVSDAFAHIPPWCNGSTRVFGTFGPGSNPGGGAWRQHVESVFPLHSIRCLLYRIQGVQASPKPRNDATPL